MTNMNTYSVALVDNPSIECRKETAESLKVFIDSLDLNEASLLRMSSRFTYLSVSATDAGIEKIRQRAEVSKIEKAEAPIFFGVPKTPRP